MASNYGLNFGFLRSDESVRVSEGRFRTPVGSALAIGTPVTIDPANAGFVKAAVAAVGPLTGVTGLLLQELDWNQSIYQTEPDYIDSFMLGIARPNRLSIITGGAGTKVWYKNTPGLTRADGRVIAPVTMVLLTGVAVGDQLEWDGTKFIKHAAGAAWATVTATNGSTFVECVLIA
jgi:hypothetical protein